VELSSRQAQLAGDRAHLLVDPVLGDAPHDGCKLIPDADTGLPGLRGDSGADDGDSVDRFVERRSQLSFTGISAYAMPVRLPWA
jgi:hypothetical protein